MALLRLLRAQRSSFRANGNPESRKGGGSLKLCTSTSKMGRGLGLLTPHRLRLPFRAGISVQSGERIGVSNSCLPPPLAWLDRSQMAIITTNFREMSGNVSDLLLRNVQIGSCVVEQAKRSSGQIADGLVSSLVIESKRSCTDMLELFPSHTSATHIPFVANVTTRTGPAPMKTTAASPAGTGVSELQRGHSKCVVGRCASHTGRPPLRLRRRRLRWRQSSR